MQCFLMWAAAGTPAGLGCLSAHSSDISVSSSAFSLQACCCHQRSVSYLASAVSMLSNQQTIAVLGRERDDVHTALQLLLVH